MNTKQMVSIVEQYCRKSSVKDESIKITQVENLKTVFVEQFDGSGRAIMMTEYQVDGMKCWAGYSTRSQTVYIRMAV